MNLFNFEQELSKINFQISQEEKAISETQALIGKRYYELHTSDFDPALSAEFEIIKKAETNIAELKQKYQEINQKIADSRCIRCGAFVEEGAVFCTSCGNRMVEPEAISEPAPAIENKNVCSCGAELDPSMRFCTSCGKPVEAPAPAKKLCSCGAELDDSMRFCTSCGKPVEAPAAAPAPEFKFCTNCGNKLPASMQFCTNCGNKL